MANLGNVAGGHKATLANPKVSEKAKEHSKQVLGEMEGRCELPEQQNRGQEGNLGNVIGGHKATLKNPNVSEEAKEHSKQVLEDMDA
ncbi:Conidiation protein 6 domain containing protein [Tylopilus felleus]